MIRAEDIAAFQDDNAEGLAQAAEFARRAAKRIPTDRWATERQMHLVAQGIHAMQAIMTWQAETLAMLVSNNNQVD